MVESCFGRDHHSTTPILIFRIKQLCYSVWLWMPIVYIWNYSLITQESQCICNQLSTECLFATVITSSNYQVDFMLVWEQNILKRNVRLDIKIKLSLHRYLHVVDLPYTVHNCIATVAHFKGRGRVVACTDPNINKNGIRPLRVPCSKHNIASVIM